jgi:hypothetical protein
MYQCKFKDAIIDNEELVKYLRTHDAKNVSPAVSTKEELKSNSIRMDIKVE